MKGYSWRDLDCCSWSFPGCSEHAIALTELKRTPCAALEASVVKKGMRLCFQVPGRSERAIGLWKHRCKEGHAGLPLFQVPGCTVSVQ